jgi:hypothetical protein
MTGSQPPRHGRAEQQWHLRGNSCRMTIRPGSAGPCRKQPLEARARHRYDRKPGNSED